VAPIEPSAGPAEDAADESAQLNGRPRS
jgi:hypothetical protein